MRLSIVVLSLACLIAYDGVFVFMADIGDESNLSVRASSFPKLKVKYWYKYWYGTRASTKVEG